MPTSRVGCRSRAPSNSSVPRDGLMSAPISLSNVDFPHPDGPTKVTNSFCLIERLISLSIKQNEFVTLVGPSGCGKSTLLKLMGALIRPSRGTLLFDGARLLHPTRDVGIVFQEAVLLAWRTV